MENNKKKVTTTMSPELAQAIRVQAAKEGRTLSEIFETLVREYLEKKS